MHHPSSASMFVANCANSLGLPTSSPILSQISCSGPLSGIVADISSASRSNDFLKIKNRANVSYRNLI